VLLVDLQKITDARAKSLDVDTHYGLIIFILLAILRPNVTTVLGISSFGKVVPNLLGVTECKL
jgi:hypothetical protein